MTRQIIILSDTKTLSEFERGLFNANMAKLVLHLHQLVLMLDVCNVG